MSSMGFVQGMFTASGVDHDGVFGNAGWERGAKRRGAAWGCGEGRPMVVRVLLLEDHVMVRELFASALEREAGFEVVAQAGTLAGARELLKDLGEGSVDVAIVDIRLPDGEGTEIIGDLRAKNPDGVALVLSASLDLGVYARAVSAGAAGALHKSTGLQEVMETIRCLAAGEALLSQRETIELLRLADRERTEGREARRALAQLTPREKEVLEALAEGMGDKEISARLGVSGGTVRGYVTAILQKLGVNSRLQALVFAVRYGFVRIGPERGGGALDEEDL